MACETNKFCCGYFARNENESVTPYVSETTYGNEEYNDKIIDKSTYSESELEKLKKYPIEYIDSEGKDNYDDGVCLGKYANNKYICKSKYDNLGRFVGAGIWDKKCTSNEDCPFYKKNKNYENDRGGCIDGFCELPLNMELVGFKNYEKNKNPYCHNCKDPSEYECCEDQNDRTEYPNLKSPDYMFENDRNDRL